MSNAQLLQTEERCK